MPSHKLPRKLTAVFYADIAGYSRLTTEDDEGTHQILRSHLQKLTSAIKGNEGRVVHYTGDGLLADFSVASNALACAVDFQNKLKQENKLLPENRKVQFRIGVNLGEVIADGNGIFGDCVNITARLESLADPGGICISGTTYDALRTKLPLPCQFMGERSVKNIKHPVRAYRVLLEAESREVNPEEISTLDIAQRSQTRKPSIAVLPFTNMSEMPGQDYFADGLTEDIITSLSKFTDLFVIARNSTFVYKNTAVSISQVAQELGVRYVLEGSIQRVGNIARVTAQLIDATTDNHLWAERYDRDYENIFEVRDEVTQSIVAALAACTGPIVKSEIARAFQPEAPNLNAYDTVLRGKQYFYLDTKSGISRSLELFKKAIELDRSFVMAYEFLAWAYLTQAINGWSHNYDRGLAKALEWALKAKTMDENSYRTHWVLGMVYAYCQQFEKSERELSLALRLNPNSSEVIANRADAFILQGRPGEAITQLKHAMRLNPHYPKWYLRHLAWAYAESGQFDEAIPLLKSSENPNEWIHCELVVCYVKTERIADAKAEVERILSLYPEFSLKEYWKTLNEKKPFLDSLAKSSHIDVLRRAGLPE